MQDDAVCSDFVLFLSFSSRPVEIFLNIELLGLPDVGVMLNHCQNQDRSISGERSQRNDGLPGNGENIPHLGLLSA